MSRPLIVADDFRDDWYGWLTNQCSHGVVGIAAAVVGEAFGWPLLTSPVVAMLAYWLLIEVGAQRLRLWRDSIVDAAHVMAGVTLAVAMERDDLTALAALVVWGAMLAHGVWRRRDA